MNTEFGMREEKEIEWEQLRKIGVEYAACAMFWICSLFVAEPDCGIPVKMWVVYYLFFRCFRNVHNIVGLLLILNNTPVYYKPVTKMIIFTTFEQFEFWWMIYGNFLFFWADNNKCKLANL
jgi:hypothetical protein